LLDKHEHLQLEPSALAGMAGPWRVAAHAKALSEQGISAESLAQATHLVWATGGGMVPPAEMAKYLAAGQAAE
ncbi:D-serine dehydratase, partial [Serratia marcescens]|nr:D-serine dehydratase [Serratia marcescens]